MKGRLEVQLFTDGRPAWRVATEVPDWACRRLDAAEIERAKQMFAATLAELVKAGNKTAPAYNEQRKDAALAKEIASAKQSFKEGKGVDAAPVFEKHSKREK
jgi:hypothetical protein